MEPFRQELKVLCSKLEEKADNLEAQYKDLNVVIAQLKVAIEQVGGHSDETAETKPALSSPVIDIPGEESALQGAEGDDRWNS